ncbi:pre-mRNA-splicing factor CWC21-like [Chenopodium quinoa]|uniref:pre-mRNA-splicing factor CWC21-like n=1 Tax=Chenopodium quinoa TaxID=63459 RepID=UPI000B771E1C|nr:pre-mRNA-splicing factor CWC21-like [Chenopodium quinoa]
MYNGIGLQTPRGSGTNGYVQTSKFLIRGKTSKVVVDRNLRFGPDQGMGCIGKKANKEILEHDQKRQIELKVVILEDKLSEQGYNDADIVDKCEDFRHKLEAEASAMAEDGYGGGFIVSDKK